MAADPLSVRAYYGILSLGFHAATSINDLFKAAYLARNPSELVPDVAGCEINIYAQTGTIIIGDAQVKTTDFAYQLNTGDSRRYGPGRMSAVPTQDIFAMASDGASTVKLGIEIIPT